MLGGWGAGLVVGVVQNTVGQEGREAVEAIQTDRARVLRLPAVLSTHVLTYLL